MGKTSFAGLDLSAEDRYNLSKPLPRAFRRAGRETIYHATQVLLYRLLFVLYAESRGLLPLNTPNYYPNSRPPCYRPWR